MSRRTVIPAVILIDQLKDIHVDGTLNPIDSHRFLAKVPAPRRRVRSVPAFRKMNPRAFMRETLRNAVRIRSRHVRWRH